MEKIKYAYYLKLQDFLNQDLNELINNLKSNFKKVFGVDPSQTEENSWIDSFKNLKNDLNSIKNELLNLVVFFELEMPRSNSRADILILGKKNKNFQAMIIEHKSWKTLEDFSPNTTLSPVDQVFYYCSYLKSYVKKLEHSDIKAISYLPNLGNNKNLENKLNPEKKDVKIIYSVNRGELKNEICNFFKEGLEENEIEEFLYSEIEPSKRLVDHIINAINENPVWNLLDEQIEIYNNIINEIKNLSNSDHKKVIIVKGDPGSGKTAIAIKLLTQCLKSQKKVAFVTNSDAFTKTIQGIICESNKNNLSGIFKKIHEIVNLKSKTKIYDILICDEAHRFRGSTTLNQIKSNNPQVYDAISSCKISIFFLDENQIVRPGEIGTVEHIREQVKKFEKIELKEFSLKKQFRNNIHYVNWLRYMFGLSKEKVDIDLWKSDFEFLICDSIFGLENMLKNKMENGYTVRLLAGFVWTWSAPDKGKLIDDIIIKEGKHIWKKPWNRMPPKGSNKSDLKSHPYYKFVTKKDGAQLNEVGCIYTSQGFEFDYIGVIFGEDLIIENNEWIAKPEKSHDKLIKNFKNKNNEITTLLKNTYFTLLTRGTKGCYIYFLHDDTKRYFIKEFSKSKI